MSIKLLRDVLFGVVLTWTSGPNTKIGANLFPNTPLTFVGSASEGQTWRPS